MNLEPEKLAAALSRLVDWDEEKVRQAFAVQAYRNLIARHIGQLPNPQHALLAPSDSGPTLLTIHGEKLYRVALLTGTPFPTITITSTALENVAATAETVADRDGAEGTMTLTVTLPTGDTVSATSKVEGDGKSDLERFALALLTA